jgi:hypothetical protein
MKSASSVRQTVFPIMAILALSAAVPVEAAALNFSCTFPTASNDEGSLQLPEPMLLRFAYDTITNDGVIIGNAGVADVTALPGDDWMTFVEVTGSGAVHTTTITKTGAVHSRNTVIGGRLVPSQYYGACIVTS